CGRFVRARMDQMSTSYVSMSLQWERGPAVRRALSGDQRSGGFLAPGQPGVQVGTPHAELSGGELDQTRAQATGAHPVEGGSGHAEFGEDFGKLEHLRACHD